MNLARQNLILLAAAALLAVPTWLQLSSDAETFTIVGAAEANPRDGKISNESPIGKAILNHKVGDTVKVETPGGTYNVKILKIS